MDGKTMSKRTSRLTLDQPARYRVQVVGHLDDKRAAWFECLDLVREYGEDGTPVTTMTWPSPAAETTSATCRTMGRPATGSSCVGCPMRSEAPAASTKGAHT